jgi:hypothetical protein
LAEYFYIDDYKKIKSILIFLSLTIYFWLKIVNIKAREYYNLLYYYVIIYVICNYNISMAIIIHAKDLRPGMTYIDNGNIFLVLENTFNKTSQAKAVIKVRVRNLRKGGVS